jgi:branched-chain amino acid transport system substrate-binding protein
MRYRVPINLIIVFLVFLLTGCKPSESNAVNVGAILPLTGGAAQYGNLAKKGIDLAVEEANSVREGSKPKIQILYEDSKTDPKEAVSALQNLLTINKIEAFITEVSGVVLATAPIAEANKVILLNCGAQNPQIRGAGEYVFSNINDANVETYQLAEYAFNKLSIRRMAILYSSASYGVGARDAMRAKFTSLGGKIVADEMFQEGATDYRTHIAKVRAARPQAVFLPGVTKDMALILKQSYESGFKPQWLSYTSFEGEDLLRIAGVAAEGAIYSSTLFDTTGNLAASRFASAFEQKYGSPPEIYAATAYDAIRILARAIDSVGYNGPRIKDLLSHMRPYAGASGVTEFDADGMVNKPVIFKMVKNQHFVYAGR